MKVGGLREVGAQIEKNAFEANRSPRKKLTEVRKATQQTRELLESIRSFETDPKVRSTMSTAIAVLMRAEAEIRV